MVRRESRGENHNAGRSSGAVPDLNTPGTPRTKPGGLGSTVGRDRTPHGIYQVTGYRYCETSNSTVGMWRNRCLRQPASLRDRHHLKLARRHGFFDCRDESRSFWGVFRCRCCTRLTCPQQDLLLAVDCCRAGAGPPHGRVSCPRSSSCWWDALSLLVLVSISTAWSGPRRSRTPFWAASDARRSRPRSEDDVRALLYIASAISLGVAGSTSRLLHQERRVRVTRHAPVGSRRRNR